MGSFTPRTLLASTLNQQSYPTSSFNPVAGELLVVSTVSMQVLGNTPTLVASANGITFTLIDTLLRGVADEQHLWVADQLIPGSPSAMTLTFDAGAAAAGAIVACGGASGVTRTGRAAVRQFIAPASTPASISVSFGMAVLTTNMVVEFYENATNPATVTPPSGWTEHNDTGFGSPTRGFEWASVNSGFTSSTVTMSGPSGSWSMFIVEIDTSAPSGLIPNVGFFPFFS